VHRDERKFASGGRDRTVKLWSLDVYKANMDLDVPVAQDKKVSPLSSAFGECLRTYNGHRKAVFDVRFVSNQNLVVSCDGQVHIWEAETGRSLQQFDAGKNNQAVSLDLVNDFGLLATATASSSIQFVASPFFVACCRH